MEFLEWVQTNASAEMAVVMGAPLAFLIAVAICWVLIFWAVRAHYKERIEAQAATIVHKQSLLDEYKDRLHGATPLEVAQELVRLKQSLAAVEGRVFLPQRTLTPEVHAKFVRAIRASAELSGLNVMVGHTPETESSRYAQKLCKALSEAGLFGEFASGTHDEGERGLILYTGDLAAPSDACKAMAAALDAAGIPYTSMQDATDGFRREFYLHVSPERDD